VSYQINLANNSKYTNTGIEIFFSKTRIKLKGKGALNYSPQIKNSTLIRDTCNWLCFCHKYKASGGEKYLVLGNFKPDLEMGDLTAIDKKVIFHGSMMYFYIDNVSVFHQRDSAQCKCDETKSENSDNSLSLLKEDTGQFSDEIILHNVYFDTDKWELLPLSFKEIDQVLFDYMIKHPDVQIQISGHTDNTGSEEYNIVLSENRAKSVVEYLLKKGISEGRLFYKGYGSSKPLAPNDSEINKALNRRVDFKIIAN
jgi:outer membrane protein OmpA-like peptidoglycan-associated protein